MGKNEKKICCFLGNENCVHRLMKLVALVLIVFVIFLMAKTYGVFRENIFIGQDIAAQNTITVTGKGEVSAVPDIAEFSFSVKEEAKTVKQAQVKATEKMNKVLDFLGEMGVNKKEIKTTRYNTYPRYEWEGEDIACGLDYCPPVNQQRVLAAYEVSQNVSIELKDVDKAGEVLAGVGSLGVANISGLNFDVDDKDGLEREARQIAIKKAQTEAKKLAKDLGVKLIRIVSYSTNGGRSISPQYAMMEKNMVYGMDETIAVPEIPVGENDIKTTVYLTYEIK